MIMHRAAFTLLELLLVVVIMIILMGFMFIGLGDITAWAQVNKVGWEFVQTTNTAKVLAAQSASAHTITFNSVKMRTATAWNDSILDANGVPGTVSGDTYANNANHLITLSPTFSVSSPSFYSEDPADQWYALLAPWRDANGTPHQARGGLPTSPEHVNASNQLVGWNGSWDNRWAGGVFGHPLRSDGTLSIMQAGQNRPISFETAAWDPLNIQIGPRRLLGNTVRFTVLKDAPEWTVFGSGTGNSRNDMRNHGRLQACFLSVPAAHISTGRPKDKNEWSVTTNFNFYPSGLIDRNFCSANAYLPSGMGFDQLSRGFLGFSSRKTREVEFTDPISGKIYTHDRPVAQIYITLYTQGDVLLAKFPSLSP